MAKLSIDKENLVAIGDALRVHFGDAVQEGTTVFQEETPKIIKTPNYDDLSTSENNGEWIAGIEEFNNTLVDTIKIHGASKIVLTLAYRTGLDQTTGGYLEDWLWLAEGAYRYVEPGKGRELKYRGTELYFCPECGREVVGTGVYYEFGVPVGGMVPGGGGGAIFEQTIERELLYCPHCQIYNCGWPYDYAQEIVNGTGFGNDLAYMGHICTDLTTSYELYFNVKQGAYRKIDTFTFNGDTFTFAIHITDRTQLTGFYGEIRAYDADGNELKHYEVTTGYLPNTYSPNSDHYTPNTIVKAIAKLNNYPNGEEVQF